MARTERTETGPDVRPDNVPRGSAGGGWYGEILRDAGLPGQSDGRLRFDEKLARMTTFRVGGPADAVFLPNGPDEVAAAIRLCREKNIPVTILGNGSNVVVADAGIRGLVIAFVQPYALFDLQEAGDGLYSVRAGAGALLSGVAIRCASAGLTGMEFACGIPGSVGGAVFMNAGAYDGCMADIVTKTQVLTSTLAPESIDRADHRFGYRTSALMDSGAIILETQLMLRRGDPDRIQARIAELGARRRQSQPLEWPSAGSVFKRPAGFYAGKLIADSGLRGSRVGGAQVSEKHAGFIVNTGGASAADIRALTDHVATVVREHTGVLLETEIRFIGEW